MGRCRITSPSEWDILHSGPVISAPSPLGPSPPLSLKGRTVDGSHPYADGEGRYLGLRLPPNQVRGTPKPWKGTPVCSQRQEQATPQGRASSPAPQRAPTSQGRSTCHGHPGLGLHNVPGPAPTPARGPHAGAARGRCTSHLYADNSTRSVLHWCSCPTPYPPSSWRILCHGGAFHTATLQPADAAVTCGVAWPRAQGLMKQPKHSRSTTREPEDVSIAGNSGIASWWMGTEGGSSPR